MATPELYVIVSIVLGSIVAPLGAAAAFGQSVTEIDRLNGLYTELAVYGYTEVADLDALGNQVEFRSNGTIPIAEDTAAELITQFGFTMTEFAPAPVGEDSIIIVNMNRSAA